MNHPTGQQAYEADLKRWPTYHDGSPRPGWENLRAPAKMIWEACAVDREKGERRCESRS
jgi:hypothetical protein